MKNKIVANIAISSFFGEMDPSLMESVPSYKRRALGLVRGGTIVVGRKTWDLLSDKLKKIPDPKIVLSSSQTKIGDAEIAKSLEEAIKKAKTSRVWVVGGISVFKEALKYAYYIHHTFVLCNSRTGFPTTHYDVRNWKIISVKRIHEGEFVTKTSSGTVKDLSDSVYIVFEKK